MTERETGPIPDVLVPLLAERWQPGEHQQRLLWELERAPRARPPGRRTVVAALAAVLLAAALLAAAGGTELLQRLLGLEVVEVERDGAGNIACITLRSDDATTLQLRPLADGADLAEPVTVELPRAGGGRVRVRVLRDADLGVLPRYESVARRGAGEVVPGARYVVQKIPCPWTATVTETTLTLSDGSRRRVLPRLPGGAPRFGDDGGTLELVDS